MKKTEIPHDLRSQQRFSDMFGRQEEVGEEGQGAGHHGSSCSWLPSALALLSNTSFVCCTGNVPEDLVQFTQFHVARNAR
jgi:hypothetical protein